MTSWPVTGRGILIGAVVGTVEGAIWWHAEGIAVIHLFLILVVPVPLGAMLAVRTRLPRWWATALAGPLAFAALVQALNALISSHSAPEPPTAFHVLPSVLAGMTGYAAVAWIAASREPRSAVAEDRGGRDALPPRRRHPPGTGRDRRLARGAGDNGPGSHPPRPRRAHLPVQRVHRLAGPRREGPARRTPVSRRRAASRPSPPSSGHPSAAGGSPRRAPRCTPRRACSSPGRGPCAR